MLEEITEQNVPPRAELWRLLKALEAQVERNEQTLLRHAPRHDAQSAQDPLTITSSAHAKSHAYDSATDHSGTLGWTKVSKTGSSLADLATRAHSNLSDAPADAHHAKFTVAEAIAAVEGESTLALAGDVTIAATKHLAMGAAIQSLITLYVTEAIADGSFTGGAFLVAQTLTGNDAAEVFGAVGQVTLDDAGHNQTGVIGGVRGYLVKGGVGTADLFIGVDAYANVAQGTVTDLYMIRAANPAKSGTLTNLHGLYIEDMTQGGTLNVAIHQVGTTGHNRLNANTKIGADSTPAEALDVAGNIAVSKAVLMTEMSTPANPSQNDLKIFARASGANIQLIARSSTGAETVLATLANSAVEPNVPFMMLGVKQ